jgi:peptidoglycan/LPS O-acetylase OafA/YrhL
VRPRRWHDLDALRGFAMLLGVALHAALSFYPTVWPVTDVTADIDSYFDEFVLAVHGFRMPLFFMLSGFFTVLLWRRRGLHDLLWHRTRRLLFPFILAVILIGPTVTWVSDRAIEAQLTDAADINGAVYLGHEAAVRSLIEAGVDPNAAGSDGNTPVYAAAITGDAAMVELLLELGADPNIPNPDGMPVDVAAYFGHREAAEALLSGGSYDPRPPEGAWEELPYWALGDVTELGLDDPSEPALPSLHHLWFLWFLILFVLLFAPVAWLTERLEARRAPGSPTPPWPRWLMWALVPAVVLPQLAMEGGGAIPAFGPDTSISWIPDRVVFAYYLLFFGFGALLYGRADRSGASIVDTVGHRWWLVLPAAAVVFLVALWTTHDLDPVSGAPVEVVGASLQVLYAWLMVFGLMGLFRAALSRERYGVRYLSDSSYWMYLTHLTLVIALQAWVRTWEANALLKFGLIVLTTCAILLILYQLVVRYTFIGTMLNGPRTRPAGSRSPLERIRAGLRRPATSQ